jgi:hypothetical protein
VPCSRWLPPIAGGVAGQGSGRLVASGKRSVTIGVVDGIGLPLTRRGPTGSPTNSKPSSELRPHPPGRAFGSPCCSASRSSAMLDDSCADGFPPMPRTVSRSWDHWSPPSSPGPHPNRQSKLPEGRRPLANLSSKSELLLPPCQVLHASQACLRAYPIVEVDDISVESLFVDEFEIESEVFG